MSPPSSLPAHGTPSPSGLRFALNLPRTRHYPIVTARSILLTERRLGDYATFVDAGELASLRRAAAPLAGLRLLHLSASPFGSAVAETLAALIPLQRDLGILAEWRVLRSSQDADWRAVYEGISGGLTGGPVEEVHAGEPSGGFDLEQVAATYDVIVVHDPQLIDLASIPMSRTHARWLWHCHLDMRAAQANLWATIRRGLRAYESALFGHKAFVPADLDLPYVLVTYPALDPCSPRNRPLEASAARSIVQRLGVDPAKPLIGQFAPIGARYASFAALGAYWLAKREIPGLQLVLADASISPGEAPGLAHAVGEAAQVLEAAENDPDIHVLTLQAGLTATDVNALQRQVSVALAMAVPRGYDWGLLECQWKAKAGIAGQHGQLAEQVGLPVTSLPAALPADGPFGVVVDGAPAAAKAVVRLLRDPKVASGMGLRARDHIVSSQLITSLLRGYLQTLSRA